jgi:hypothetical protein
MRRADGLVIPLDALYGGTKKTTPPQRSAAIRPDALFMCSIESDLEGFPCRAFAGRYGSTKSRIMTNPFWRTNGKILKN